MVLSWLRKKKKNISIRVDKKAADNEIGGELDADFIDFDKI